MSFRSWFAAGQVARTFDSLQQQWRRSPRRRRPVCRLQFEALENRSMLTTFIAATSADLIADINAANKAGGANTITLAANTTFDLTAVDNTTDGANGLPVISGKSTGKHGADNLTIVGNADLIERPGGLYSAYPDFRLFDVASGGSLTLENLALHGGVAQGQGTAADGGAIFNQGTLILSGATVEVNTAQGADGKLKGTHSVPQPGYDAAGGGIWSNGSLTLENNTVLAGNLAEGGNAGSDSGVVGTGGNAFGGGLYVAGGTANSTGTDFENNGAGFDGISASDKSGYGGGIYVVAGTVNLTGDSLDLNRAAGSTALLTGQNVGGNGYGGGLFVAGGNVSISDVTVAFNAASGGRDAAVITAFGGGLYVAAGTVTMRTDSVFSNSAISDRSGLSLGAGGGIFIASGATVYLDSFTVSNTGNNTDQTGTDGSTADIDGTYILLT